MTFTNLERELLANHHGWTCHLCGGDIPKELSHGHPLFLNIDHVIPQSLGGQDTIDNLVPAHSFCNTSKQNRNYWRSQEDAAIWLYIRLNHWKSIHNGKAIVRLSYNSDQKTELYNVRGFKQPVEMTEHTGPATLLGVFAGKRLVIRLDPDGNKYFKHDDGYDYDPLYDAVEQYEKSLFY